MNDAIEQLQRRLADYVNQSQHPEFCAQLSVLAVGEWLYLDFYGSPFDEPYEDLCNTLILPEVAFKLGSLSFRSPTDEGANGTRNCVIVAAVYEEAGVLGRLLRKAPSLDSLIVPSAPDVTFFELERHPLRFLSVDAGYDTQGFIGNLADSSCFPQLQRLEFGEFNETYLDDFPAGCTPFDDYRRLFTSAAFATVRAFVWRNPVCSDTEIAELRSLRPKSELQIQIVQFLSRYV
jgi:hypothetical protein